MKSIQFSIVSRLPGKADNACQLLFLYADGKLKGAARKIDAENDGLIKSLYHRGDFTGKQGQTLMLHGVAGTPAARVLLTGLGEHAADDETRERRNWRSACAAAGREMRKSPCSTAISDCLAATSFSHVGTDEMAERLATELVCANYVFTLHERKDEPERSALHTVVLSVEKKLIEQTEAASLRGLAIGRGMSTARDLGNLAPNICTPGYLADRAELLASEHDNLQATIIDEAQMEELGMGAFLAVSRGSQQPGKLIVMEYQGQKRAGKPLVLIGKGVTFDTGGISIKPSESMDEMKYDMCGAASVFGTLQAIAILQLPIHVIGIVAAAENMPDGAATRPGDVVTSMSGQSIEILNTDAEGRLVLCDALTYAERFKPDTVLDMATLTGACITALGRVASGVMGNDQEIIDALMDAGERSGDRCWSLPLWDDYQKQLESNFADMANIGGRPAGTITAACFLSRFAKDFRWAHLDIAGTAWLSGMEKGATGRPVPLLMQFVFDRLA